MSSENEFSENVRAAFRRMAKVPVPPALAAKLRVMASHERARQLSHRNFSARLEHWTSSLHLAFDNLMRPLALPFAGGTLSAIVIFTLLVPSLTFPHRSGDDPPTAVYTYAYPKIVGARDFVPRIEPADSPIYTTDTVLELTIDEGGQVRDWTVSDGGLTREMVSVILNSQFTPATVFGQPTWGKIQLVYPRRSRGMRS
jgi:hypothetical protein